MRVHCLQLDVVWERKQANHERARALLDEAAPSPGDLVLLPELFATGFSMRVAEISDAESRETQEFLAATAAERSIYLLGGIAVATASGMGRNECVAYGPDGGEIARYCKIHPFSFGGESRYYERGDEPALFAWGDLVVAPFICYDLRFPEVFRAATVRGATLLAVVANWPSARVAHWELLLRARAIENQAYVAGVNRCGSDPHLDYPGRSAIIDPKGRTIVEAGDSEQAISAEVDVLGLERYRREFPALADIALGFVRGAPGS